MANTWNMRVEAALAQFDHEQRADQLLYTIQQCRMASTTKPTKERREILDAGRPMAKRATEALNSGQVYGDTVGLMIETGLYLLECARPTVEEFGAPPDMISGTADSATRLGPQLGSEDFVQGVTLMTNGFVRGMTTGDNVDQLNALRNYIIDTVSGLIMTSGNIEEDSKQLSLLCWITQKLEDDLLFTQATSELSDLMRKAKQPEVAEAIIKKALEWPLLQQQQRNELKVELASALSEQGKFPEAEAIQREVLEGIS